MSANYFDLALFAVMPYVAILTFLMVTIQRYRSQAYTYSTLSSQFLENDRHFWGMVPFHYGILFVLGGHIVGFLLPRQLLAWNSVPLRLYVLESTAFIFALLALIGLVNLIVRRATNPKLRLVTTRADVVVLALLVVQLLSGIGVAFFHRWGSSWYATSMVPYLWSIVWLRPDLSTISAMPFLVKFHIVSAYVMIFLFPFTRLVHMLVVPNPYFWRRTQVVRWNYNPRKIRRTDFEVNPPRRFWKSQT